MKRESLSLLEWVSQPWPWYVSGSIIALTMVLLLFLGRSFGMSATLRAACSAMGAGKRVKFFDFNWKKAQTWNLVFAGGAILGGWIASTVLASPEPVAIAADTVAHLQGMGVTVPTTMEQGTGYLPEQYTDWSFLATGKGLVLLVGGGFLIGFGARYAGGCTSGHAISGLSNLQIPSLIAVIGFFIGGLTATYFLLPLLF